MGADKDDAKPSVVGITAQKGISKMVFPKVYESPDLMEKVLEEYMS